MDKNTAGKNEEKSQQAAQSRNEPINPFKDATGSENTQPSAEEESDLEQQRKEALTERD